MPSRRICRAWARSLRLNRHESAARRTKGLVPMSDVTELHLADRRKEPPYRRPHGVDWKTVAAIIAAIVAILSWLGASPREYADLVSRVTTLEANRANDVQQQKRLEETEQRIEAKVDAILERLAK